MDPERAHELVAQNLKWLSAIRPLCRLMEKCNQVPGGKGEVELFGLKFPNAVGLGAGFDKDATFWPALMALGFGHVEIGTVTYERQPGNPKPRMFRYPNEEALINRMGFNNDGAERIAQRLKKQLKGGRPRAPLGINLGKSKAASLEHAAEDYLGSFEKLAEFADYITINVSSPNTPDLRKLQEESRLVTLLEQIQAANVARAAKLGTKKLPMLVKIAPDLTYPQIDSILEVIQRLDYNGVIATNTTLERPGTLATVDEQGGLSGKPLRRRSTDIINYISRITNGNLPIIGVGGIHDITSASEKTDAGASMVQIYTGMIYQGPFFPKEVARCLAARGTEWWG